MERADLTKVDFLMMHRLYVIRWWIWFASELFLPTSALARWWSLEPRWKGRRRWT